jgi:hypothetical protein
MFFAVKINKEIGHIVDKALATKLEQLRTVLCDNEIPEHVVRSIFAGLQDSTDYVRETFELFKSVKLTEKYLRDNFKYIPPTTVKLGSGTFQYVSIRETLNKIETDHTFQRMKKKRNPHRGDGEGFLLEDIEDGLLFKESKFFLKNPDALR